MRGITTFSLLGMVTFFLIVLAIETFKAKLSPQEFAEIVGPFIVGIATGVFGYYFNTERKP